MENIMLIVSIKQAGKKTYSNVKHNKRKKRTYEMVEKEAECSRTIKITDEAALYWVKDEAFSMIPQMRKVVWLQMGKIKRIEAFLATISDGNPYSYEIVS